MKLILAVTFIFYERNNTNENYRDVDTEIALTLVI